MFPCFLAEGVNYYILSDYSLAKVLMKISFLLLRHIINNLRLTTIDICRSQEMTSEYRIALIDL